MKIEFIDLQTQHRKLKNSIQNRINAVMENGKYVMGPEIFELEQKLADYVGVKHCVSCSNGTDALLMALMIYGVGPGDFVLTTPFTFVATAEVISLTGAKPVFVDIDSDTKNLDVNQVEDAVMRMKKEHPNKLKGIIAVDIFGLPSDYDALLEIAQTHHLFLIEDGAQSFGATYKRKKACSLGNISTTSFFPAKPLGCYGDGGAIFTDDDEVAETLKSIRVHGQGKSKYQNVRLGLNARLDTLQAAILLEKLIIFPEEVKSRQKIAEKYSKALKNYVGVPTLTSDKQSAWALYSIVTDKREQLKNALNEKGIPTVVYYEYPLHLQGAFKDLNYHCGDFPVSELISQTILSLPMHPYLSDEEIDFVIKEIKNFFK